MEDPIRNSIKTLTRAFYDYQRERISLDGRIARTKDGSLKKNAPEVDAIFIGTLIERRDGTEINGVSEKNGIIHMEEKLGKDLAKEVHTHPLWINFLVDVKGCGEAMAAVIISEIDIHKAPTVSNLWSFAGLNPGMVPGKKKKKGVIIATDTQVRGDKLTPGFLCPFNQFLRAKLCGVLGSSFLKANSPYREYYDNMKHRLEAEGWGMDSKNPTDKTRPKAGHQHKAATRYMVKMFLKDLYVAWRTIENLPIREPYQEEYLGHKHDKKAD